MAIIPNLLTWTSVVSRRQPVSNWSPISSTQTLATTIFNLNHESFQSNTQYPPGIHHLINVPKHIRLIHQICITAYVIRFDILKKCYALKYDNLTPLELEEAEQKVDTGYAVLILREISSLNSKAGNACHRTVSSLSR